MSIKPIPAKESLLSPLMSRVESVVPLPFMSMELLAKESVTLSPKPKYEFFRVTDLLPSKTKSSDT